AHAGLALHPAGARAAAQRLGRDHGGCAPRLRRRGHHARPAGIQPWNPGEREGVRHGAATAGRAVKSNQTVQRRVLNPDGTLVRGAEPKLDEEFVLEALRWMLMSRLLDQRATALQRQGRWGTFSPVVGQEA